MRSHPSWVCGLKLLLSQMQRGQYPSHPSWVCGLKHVYDRKNLSRPGVTPFVGVWIETANSTYVRWKRYVTPFVGVWIETSTRLNLVRRSRSHTLRGCVDWNLKTWRLKLTKSGHTLRGCVDWNSRAVQKMGRKTVSHPSWVCGLKLIIFTEDNILMGHTLRGCVDWNITIFCIYWRLSCHTLRGCVDWNTTAEGIYAAMGVTPFVGLDWNIKVINRKNRILSQ